MSESPVFSAIKAPPLPLFYEDLWREFPELRDRKNGSPGSLGDALFRRWGQGIRMTLE